MKLPQTEEEKKIAKADCINLLKHPGWILIKSVIENNIKVLESYILDNLEADFESIKLKKAKLQAYKDVLKTPDMFINEKKAVEGGTDLDPYYKPDEME